jgi:hypothetical protein
MNHGRLMLRIRAALTGAAMLPVLAVGMASSPVTASANTTRFIPSSGTATITGSVASSSTAGVENPEFPGVAEGDAAGAAGASGPNRSHSSTVGGSTSGIATGDGNGTVAGSNPELATSFQGLNHFINRFGVSGGNQFSLEPPDQGLCATNGVILETLNDVLAVYKPDGSFASGPEALNAFYGYPFAINRHTGVRGQFVTDPSCLFDAATQRWFHVVLTLETVPSGKGAGRFTGKNHLDLAVSQTSSPSDGWNIYRVPVQDDGTDGTPDHHCSGIWYDGTPNNTCLGDFPHIGADANGFYITTNEYSFFGNDFHGAQLYAFSKQALAAGAATVAVTQIDTHGMDNGNSGFTLAPAQVPPGGAQESMAGGTEYFLSSNAADEAHGNGASVGPRSSNQILVWALTNTSSLDGTPALALNHTTLGVGTYAFPSPSNQMSGPTPLRDCLNNNACSIRLNGFADPFQEKEYNLDSSDTRMMQTTFAQGQLWGALDTSLSHASSKSAGVEWFVVQPAVSGGGAVSATATNTGYLGLPDDNLTYPAIGVTAAGRGVMAFTVVGGDRFPSAGYALISSSGVGSVHVAKEGAGPADGFSGYIIENLPNPIRPRWGDYGAAAVVGNQVWIGSEYIGQTCDLDTYEATNFRCGNTRTALANWDTRISLVTP